MGLIKIKRNRCPKKKEDDDKKKECKGTFVPIIKMLALAWIVSLGLLILTVVINLFVLLFSFAYYKNKKESQVKSDIKRKLDMRGDWFLTPEEAVEYGFADAVEGV